MVTILALRQTTQSLQVEWSDHVVSRYPWIWLRDHAHDDATLHPVTQQRQLFTAGLPTNLQATAVGIHNNAVRVNWADTTEPSVMPISFLRDFRVAQPTNIEVEQQPRLWNAELINCNTPAVDYQQVMKSDDGVRDWLTNVAEFGFCLVTGTPATAEASETLLRRIGYVRETIFGAFWQFTADLTKADTAYTNLELRPHTDGTYSADAPGAQMLHCLYFEGSGGESTMVDSFAIAARLRAEQPRHYDTLSRVVVPGQYIGDGSHLMAQRPVFRHDHLGQLVQVSFNNYDRAPFLLPEDDMIAFYDAVRAFDTMANDHANQWRHVLAPGEALLFDNWRVLHGREAYTGRREMCGGYVNREDMHSRQRQLASR